MGALCGALIVGVATLVELQPLHDNSFLTHLATGRAILERGTVPSTDPYTFTAAGEPWVVQSWLASVLYATTERVAGLDGLRALAGLTAGILTALAWRLLRPIDGLVARLGVAAIFVVVGAGLWAERPFMFGLVAFAIVVLAAEGGLDPRWLVPLGWVWVNTHGSFPLGIVYLVVAAAGARLDGGDARAELRSLRFASAGIVLGVAGPLGLRALTFPVELLRRQDVLRHVVEWQAPAFDSLSQRAFLVQLLAAIVLLVRRPSYRAALVVSVFSGTALLGSRNLAVASVAMLPAMASSLGGVGTVRTDLRVRGAPILAAVMALAGAVVLVDRVQEPPLELQAYPVDALAYLDEVGVGLEDTHLAAPEFVGNLVTMVYGPGRRVFYDDRFDMFPDDVSSAAVALTDAEPTVFRDLAPFDIDMLAARRDSPMALVLVSTDRWRILFTDEQWVLACRREAPLGGALGTC